MVLRKISIDNSVRYVPKNEKPKERDSKPKTIKADSLPCKQDKNFSKKNEKFVKDFTSGGFGILK